MMQKLQPFISQSIGRIEQQEDIQFIYSTSGELIGEIHMKDGLLSRVDFYDIDVLAELGVPLTNNAICDALLRPNTGGIEVEPSQIPHIAHRIKEALDDRPLKLEVVVDFDTNYVVTFEEIEPKFGLTLPNTGLQLSIKRDGTLESATFMRQHCTIKYPETMISRQVARDMILQEQLMQLTIDTQQWNYVYEPKQDVYGVDVDGHVKKMSTGCSYDVLPEVKVDMPLEMMLLGGRQVDIEYNEDEEERHWHVLTDEYPVRKLDEQSYIRACQALKLVVAEQYMHYEYERTNVYDVMPLYLQEMDSAYTTYRFVYRHHDLYLVDKAVEITVHNQTSQIQEVVVPIIPYERLNRLPLPIISLEEVNSIAKQQVDVILTLGRIDFENNVLEPMYVIDYPNSPTGGHIEFINAYTAETTYVDTGFVAIEE